MNKKIIITLGDPNGIGSEIVIKALSNLSLPKEKCLIIGNSEVLKAHGADRAFLAKYETVEVPFEIKNLNIGKVTKEAGDFAFQVLHKACSMVVEDVEKYSGIVTAPTSKEAMNLAGHKFSGQTEILEKYIAKNGQKAQMFFYSDILNVLLLTRHLPLVDVAKNITVENFVENVLNLQYFFKKHLLIDKPKFALCGLNPHAGEGGLLGCEEKEIFEKGIAILKNKGVNITAPMPADALFARIAARIFAKQDSGYDCVISPYHDQGLIPVKMLVGNRAVNTTIGLNTVRTSPAHGTAFDIAGKNLANPQSMEEAIKFFL